ncbi:hypothetical protein CAEBREN_06103 [Caenorhabditis brenneri]|uniref:Up-regulated in Daf-2 domain-containing protein n=1 Tax=Caenorhabditis brenneri TaxID=135651 RepID=G0PG23_CAEBE|nr:hypothetical protein CAEBREN_06103 [Caenorhabditis brenneri]
MSSPDPPPPQATNRTANVYVENKTKDIFEVQILHKYTGDPIQDTNFERIMPGENKFMLKVNYRTGFFTTGVDNWKVNAVKFVESGEFNDDGTKRYKKESWRIGHSVADDWKKHMLSGDDDGCKTTIYIRDDEVEFSSPSGTSTSKFYKE